MGAVISDPAALLFAAHPQLLAPVLQIIHRVIATFLIQQAGFKRTEADTGAVTLIQRFGSAANLNIPLHPSALPGYGMNANTHWRLVVAVLIPTDKGREFYPKRHKKLRRA